MSPDYREKLDRALMLAGAAGISRSAAFPPLLRSLSKLGLPVRPLHFMSTLGLVVFLFLGMATLFLAFHWLAVSIDVNAWALNKLRQLGQPGVVAAAALVALITAVVVRFQALRADLPVWRDL